MVATQNRRRTPAKSPRAIIQPAAVFLVTRAGTMWRVFDAPDPWAAERKLPSPSSKLPVRLFVPLAKRREVHAVRLEGGPRDLGAETLQRQLDASEVV